MYCIACGARLVCWGERRTRNEIFFCKVIFPEMLFYTIQFMILKYWLERSYQRGRAGLLTITPAEQREVKCELLLQLSNQRATIDTVTVPATGHD